MRHWRWFVWAALVGGLIVSLIEPPWPKQQWLQHAPSVLSLVVVGALLVRKRIATTAFACFSAFLALHILGARWIYSFVPYDEWLRAAFDADTRAWFGWNRNHYDRFVHLAFGALLVPPILVRAAPSHGRMRAALLALTLVLAISAIYEIFEWALTVAMNPKRADLYNGQQGDMWDAQKDMALAGVGALVAMSIDRVVRRNSTQSQ